MVTGELKSKIDNLWEIFWTGGLTNPFGCGVLFLSGTVLSLLIGVILRLWV